MGIANIISLLESNLNILELVHLTVTGDASAGYKITKICIAAMNYSKLLTEPYSRITWVWLQQNLDWNFLTVFCLSWWKLTNESLQLERIQQSKLQSNCNYNGNSIETPVKLQEKLKWKFPVAILMKFSKYPYTEFSETVITTA